MWSGGGVDRGGSELWAVCCQGSPLPSRPSLFGIRRSHYRGTTELLDAVAVHVGAGVTVHPVEELEPDLPVAADPARGC
jgi:hypothetical protein